MANAETNWIDFFISLTPVAQTGIWAGVAVGLVLMLRRPIQQFASELVQRVNDGDRITTPFVTIERQQGRDQRVVDKFTSNFRNEIKTTENEREGPFTGIDADQVDALLDKVGRQFIDLKFLAKEFKTKNNIDTKISLYITDWLSVSEFLNDVYFAAVESGIKIPIWTYGKYWRLKNERTGEILIKNVIGEKLDTRPFDHLCVKPGDVLIAERVK